MSAPSYATTETRSIRITVIGHASTRWRGAKTNAQADHLNQILSNKRADTVRLIVEQNLKHLLPGVRILADRSFPPGVHPGGVPLGAYGVGSSQPVLNPVKSPNRDSTENEYLNRSVYVNIHWDSTIQGFAGRSNSAAPETPSKEWTGHVMRLWGGGAGAELLFMELEITNPHTGKTGTYEAKLLGGGLPTLETPGLRKGVGKPFDFTTNDPMRFKHFNGRFVRVERVGAGLAYDGIGAKAYATYLTFVGLGSGASALSFDTGFGFAKTPSLAAFVVGGELKLTKTDLDGHGTTTMVPYKTERGWGDGLIVRFPTGKFGARDMNREDRVRLDNFVKWWVAKL